MKTYRLAPTWHRMGWTAKAGWLCATGQARDYSDACSILWSFRKRRVPPTVQVVVARNEQLKLW